MQQLKNTKRHGSARSFCMIEGLESRQLMSASPAAHLAPATAGPLLQVGAVAPKKILAGSAGTDTVTIHNPTAATVTEAITVTLAPSLDGITASGAYPSASLSETVTIKKHGALKVKVPFTTASTLGAGKYHTIATAVLDTTTVSATSASTFVVTQPPTPTTTPSLVGHYSGLITQAGGGITHKATFIWFTNAQDLTSLSGQISVGSQETTGTMTGSELASGAINYTLTSDKINYVIKGTVTPDGSTITGTFKGTLVDNIFKKLNGHFKLTLQAS